MSEKQKFQGDIHLNHLRHKHLSITCENKTVGVNISLLIQKMHITKEKPLWIR